MPRRDAQDILTRSSNSSCLTHCELAVYVQTVGKLSATDPCSFYWKLICGVLLLADEHIAWTCTVGDEMSSYTHTHTLTHAHVRTHTHIGVTETKPNCPTALRGGQLLKNDIGTLFVYCKLRILSNCPARGAAGQLGLVCTKCCSQSLCVTQSVSLR